MVIIIFFADYSPPQITEAAQYVEQKADADRKTQETIERMQKENAALKQRIQDFEAKVTRVGGSANLNANSDRFQPKADQSLS